MRPILLVLLAAAALVACSSAPAPTPEAPKLTSTGIAPGSKATDFIAYDSDGKPVHLADYLGKQVVLLDFYTTWCEPCVAELPHMKRFHEQGKDNGLVIIGIAMDGPETVANVRGFVQRNQLGFPMLLDQDSRIALAYNPMKAAPFVVLIDRSGTVALTRVGYTPGDEEPLAKEIAKLLPTATNIR